MRFTNETFVYTITDNSQKLQKNGIFIIYLSISRKGVVSR